MSIGANTLAIGCFNSWNFPKECQAVLQKVQVSGFTCGWTIFPHTTCQALRIFKLKTSPCRWVVFFANNQCHKLTQWQQMSLSRMMVSRSGPVRTYWRPPQTGQWRRTSSAWKLVIWELDILESFFSSAEVRRDICGCWCCCQEAIWTSLLQVTFPSSACASDF